MSSSMLVLDANILIRAVLGNRVRSVGSFCRWIVTGKHNTYNVKEMPIDSIVTGDKLSPVERNGYIL